MPDPVFVALGRHLGDAICEYWAAWINGSTEETDLAAERLYRTWVSVPIHPDAEQADER